MNSSSIEQVLAHGIHALAGGRGSLVVLLPGWPETAEAYSDVFPLLAAGHQLLVLDPPGLGDSAPSPNGYDTAQISRMMADAVKGQRKVLITSSVTMWARGLPMPGQRSFLGG